MTQGTLISQNIKVPHAQWSVAIGGFPAEKFIRFRIKADFANNVGTVISPRSNDPVGFPFGWHTFFTDPKFRSNSPNLYLYVTIPNWDQIWDNLDPNTTYGIFTANGLGGE